MIKLEQVNFVYNNTKPDTGVHNINLQIPKGQVVLLCGSSGCGKTTLARMMNGLIPNFYEGELFGNITVCGLDTKISELYEPLLLVPFFKIPNRSFTLCKQIPKLFLPAKILEWKREKYISVLKKS